MSSIRTQRHASMKLGFHAVNGRELTSFYGRMQMTCRISKSILAVSTVAIGSLISSSANAEQRATVRSDDMRDVLMTAGYASVFGAATGVALLPFLSGGVSSNLRIVAGGASIGFLAGSAFGFYSMTNQTRAYSDNYDYNAPNNETYSLDRDSYRNQDGEPLSSLPSTECKTHEIPTNALIVGCGHRISLNWPRPLIAPQGFAVPVLNIRF
jgi:hypothetical protein